MSKFKGMDATEYWVRNRAQLLAKMKIRQMKPENRAKKNALARTRYQQESPEDREARRQRRHASYLENKDKEQAQSRAYHQAHPEVKRAWKAAHRDQVLADHRRTNLRLRHRMTAAEYAALVAAQRGQCAICYSVIEPTHRLQVDHDHLTGVIRGLLCGRCNRCMGLLKDDTRLLRAAIAYIENHIRVAHPA